MHQFSNRTNFFTLAFALIIPVIAAGLCGCKRQDSPVTVPRPDPHVITIWWAQIPQADVLQRLANSFGQETGISVQVQKIPVTQFERDVLAEIRKDVTEFDIVVGDPHWLGQGAAKSTGNEVSNTPYLELTDWMAENLDLSNINARVLKNMCEYPPGSGRYYAAPCLIDIACVAYRRDWFASEREREAFRLRYGRELAPPRTWTQFHEIAQFFYRPDQDQYGVAMPTARSGGSLVFSFQQMMWAGGGGWRDDDGKIQGALNGKAGVDAANFLRKMVALSPESADGYDYDQAIDTFVEGSAAMMVNYASNCATLVDLMPGAVDFFAMPRQGTNRGVTMGGYSLSVSNKTTDKKREMALKFIRWFQEHPNQIKWSLNVGCLTADRRILKSETFRTMSGFNRVYFTSVDDARIFSRSPHSVQLRRAATASLGRMLDGDEPAQQVLDELATRYEKISQSHNRHAAP